MKFWLEISAWIIKCWQFWKCRILFYYYFKLSFCLAYLFYCIALSVWNKKLNIFIFFTELCLPDLKINLCVIYWFSVCTWRNSHWSWQTFRLISPNHMKCKMAKNGSIHMFTVISFSIVCGTKLANSSSRDFAIILIWETNQMSREIYYIKVFYLWRF